MFTIHKTDTGAVAPIEYMGAAAGEYKIGRFLRINEGLLTADAEAGSSTHYLCMTQKTLAAEEPIPVVRVNKTMILKDDSGTRDNGYDFVGAEADVSSTGDCISADGMGIILEIVAMDDDATYVRLK